jgi:hypothetical protein
MKKSFRFLIMFVTIICFVFGKRIKKKIKSLKKPITLIKEKWLKVRKKKISFFECGNKRQEERKDDKENLFPRSKGAEEALFLMF